MRPTLTIADPRTGRWTPGRVRLSLLGAVLTLAAASAVADPGGSLAPPPPVFVGTASSLPPSPAPSIRSEQDTPERLIVDNPSALERPIAASLPEPAEAVALILPFPADGEDVTPDAARRLDVLAARLLSRPDERVELRAHAAPTDLGEGAARRQSLARALSVRVYLIERGIAQHRLIVYALGSGEPAPPGQPTDRVDLTVIP